MERLQTFGKESTVSGMDYSRTYSHFQPVKYLYRIRVDNQEKIVFVHEPLHRIPLEYRKKKLSNNTTFYTPKLSNMIEKTYNIFYSSTQIEVEEIPNAYDIDMFPLNTWYSVDPNDEYTSRVQEFIKNYIELCKTNGDFLTKSHNNARWYLCSEEMKRKSEITTNDNETPCKQPDHVDVHEKDRKYQEYQFDNIYKPISTHMEPRSANQERIDQELLEQDSFPSSDIQFTSTSTWSNNYERLAENKTVLPTYFVCFNAYTKQAKLLETEYLTDEYMEFLKTQDILPDIQVTTYQIADSKLEKVIYALEVEDFENIKDVETKMEELLENKVTTYELKQYIEGTYDICLNYTKERKLISELIMNTSAYFNVDASQVRSILPYVLTDLGLLKKRFKEGVCWYGMKTKTHPEVLVPSTNQPTISNMFEYGKVSSIYRDLYAKLPQMGDIMNDVNDVEDKEDKDSKNVLEEKVFSRSWLYNMKQHFETS